MAVFMLAIIIFFSNFVTKVFASYHWVVTENGKIQTETDNSAFPLRRSYDLLALLEQEKRVNEANDIYKVLLKHKVTIDNPWQDVEGASELENKLYKHDVDCIISGKPLNEHNLRTNFLEYYDSTSILKRSKNSPEIEPECTKYYKLDYSLCLFHHLQTLNDRTNLTMLLPLENEYNSDLDLNKMLHKNRTNWVVYNLAAWYWRTKNDPAKAIECSRRALYFAPRDKRYIPLLNLGTLLQDVQSLGESAIVLHAAVDHSPIQHITHLALGNVYVALGDYNRSLACYENVLRLQNNHERARTLRHAVLCHKKLESGLVSIHQTLQSMLEDLQKYHDLQEKWLVLQNHLNLERDSKHHIDEALSFNLHLLLQNQAKIITDVKTNNLKEAKPKRVERNSVKTEHFYECEADTCGQYHVRSNEDVTGGENDVTKHQQQNIRNMKMKEIENKLEPFLIFFKNQANIDGIVDFKNKILNQARQMSINEDESNIMKYINECLNKFDTHVQVQNCLLINFKKKFYHLKYKLNNLIDFNKEKEKYFDDETQIENYNEFDWLEFNTDSSDWSNDDYNMIKSEL